MFEGIKEYLIKIEPYQDGYKSIVAYFLSLLGGKGIGLLKGIADPIMNYIVLAVALTVLITATNTLRGSNKLFYWLGWIMIILNALTFKVMGIGMIIGIVILMIWSGVLKNLKMVEDIGGLNK